MSLLKVFQSTLQNKLGVKKECISDPLLTIFSYIHRDNNNFFLTIWAFVYFASGTHEAVTTNSLKRFF